jgi:hypothetical protein
MERIESEEYKDSILKGVFKVFSSMSICRAYSYNRSNSTWQFSLEEYERLVSRIVPETRMKKIEDIWKK